MFFDATTQLKKLEILQLYSLTEQQFAHLIGCCKLYQLLHVGLKQDIPELKFGDSQINTVCRDYYKDDSFCRSKVGDISLRELYNLFPAANRNSYINSLLEWVLNAVLFTGELVRPYNIKSTNWSLS